MTAKPIPRERPRNGAWRLLHGVLLLGFFFGVVWAPALQSWPLFWIGPLAAYGLTTLLIGPLRRSFQPWRFGAITPLTISAAAIVAFVSCAILFAFQAAFQPNLEELRGLLPTVASRHLLVASYLFPLLNATLEEVFFRGGLYDAAEGAGGKWLAIASTSILFGYGHLHGYPPGPIGAVLAGIYGLALGWLRARSGGLGLAVLVHVTADASIFVILLRAGILP